MGSLVVVSIFIAAIIDSDGITCAGSTVIVGHIGRRCDGFAFSASVSLALLLRCSSLLLPLFVFEVFPSKIVRGSLLRCGRGPSSRGGELCVAVAGAIDDGRRRGGGVVEDGAEILSVSVRSFFPFCIYHIGP